MRPLLLILTAALCVAVGAADNLARRASLVCAPPPIFGADPDTGVAPSGRILRNYTPDDLTVTPLFTQVLAGGEEHWPGNEVRIDTLDYDFAAAVVDADWSWWVGVSVAFPYPALERFNADGPNGVTPRNANDTVYVEIGVRTQRECPDGYWLRCDFDWLEPAEVCVTGFGAARTYWYRFDAATVSEFIGGGTDRPLAELNLSCPTWRQVGIPFGPSVIVPTAPPQITGVQWRWIPEAR